MADENTFSVYTPPAAKPYPGAHWVTEKIGSLVLTPHTPVEWIVTFGAMFTGTLGLLFAIAWLLIRGIGIWGVNIPIAWGFAIVNFVWWIGIGHAGTLISAILLLLHQAWRQSINRFAEAMTLFAVACAGLFPLIHLAGHGSSIGSRRTRTPWDSGRSGEVRWCGTCSRSVRISLFRWCSGTSA